MVACSMLPAVAWVSMRAGDAEDLPPGLLPSNGYKALGDMDHPSSYILLCIFCHHCFSLLVTLKVCGWRLGWHPVRSKEPVGFQGGPRDPRRQGA